MLDISRGNISSAATKYEVPLVDLPRGFNMENAAKLRRETGMLTVAVGRGQLSDPKFCNKVTYLGKTDTLL